MGVVEARKSRAGMVKGAHGVRSTHGVRHVRPVKAAPAAKPVSLPRELAHIAGLKTGDVLHLALRDGCVERTISGLVPGHGYRLSNGGSVWTGAAVFYHLPERCPARHPAEPARHEVVRDFKIPSSTHPGIVYTVHVSETGTLVCNCGAGSYGRPCKHKRQVADLLRQQKSAA